MNLGKKSHRAHGLHGVQVSALSECVKAAGEDVVLNINQCFVRTAVGAMNLEDQVESKRRRENRRAFDWSFC